MIEEQKSKRLPVALTIAGSDSGAGAGIQADLLTFADFGVFGTSAITAITAQNPDGVSDIQVASPENLAAQIRQVLEFFPVRAIKTGMLPTEGAVKIVAAMLEDNLDMVVGSRRDEVEAAYRRGHRFGNWALTTLLKQLFGRSFTDILSGYRVFSRRFVKSFPVLSAGFEIETEMSVHALELAMPVAEVVTAYGARPEGSVSKLSTYRDGFRILRTIITLYRIERPVLFFGIIAALLAVLALGLAAPLIVTYLETGLVPRFPTAILVTGLMILATLSAMCGLILDTVVRGRREVRRLAYLAFRAPSDYARP